MKQFTGTIHEIRINSNQEKQAVISNLPKLILNPGQFLQAYAPGDHDTPFAISLFPFKLFQEDNKFLTAAPIPNSWTPGTRLNLRGPIGNGFKIKNSIKRLAVISLDKSPDRILALAEMVLEGNIEVALFTDSILPQLSHQIEANPLSEVENAFDWADLVAIDSPSLPHEKILKKLGLKVGNPIPCPTQILLHSPMPCAGLAECGVCSIKNDNHKSLLVCEEGPVFRLTSKGFQILD